MVKRVSVYVCSTLAAYISYNPALSIREKQLIKPKFPLVDPWPRGKVSAERIENRLTCVRASACPLFTRFRRGLPILSEFSSGALGHAPVRTITRVGTTRVDTV